MTIILFTASARVHFTRVLLLASLVLMILTACVSKPAVRSPPSIASQMLNQAHLQHVAEIQRFSLQGRIGVQTNSKGFSGSLHWQHDSTNDNVALFSPLGSQVASIQKNIDGITLEEANGNTTSAKDAETLTQTALGWQLPLTGLADWSLGRPANSPIQDSTWNEQGLLTTLNQDDWQIEFKSYSEQNGYLLPTKIILKSEKVNLKLLIEKWQDFKHLSIGH